VKRALIYIFLLLFLFVVFNFKIVASINYTDAIRNSDELLIKAFRSRPNYSIKELRQLEIEYLDVVDGYRVYFVPLKASHYSLPLVKDSFTFPSESLARIVGIKNGRLHVLGELVKENDADTRRLYELMQIKFKY
jgi:hypothetical protein